MYNMRLEEAKQILKNRGFLVEFRDSSQEKDREIDDDSQVDGRRSWNNAKARVSGYDNSDTRKEKRVVEKTVNELIEKVDEVVNRFEDYDYFVKRYDYEKIQIRTTDNGVTGGPFLQISAYYDSKAGKCSFECVTGRTSDKVYRDYMLTDCYDEEKVLKWVSKCLGDGIINHEYN